MGRGLGGIYIGFSVNDGQETGYKAGMCPHAIGGTPNRPTGRRRNLEQDEGRMKTKITLILIKRGPEILFLFLVKLKFTT